MEQLADRARRYKYLHQKTYETDLLMIDEISVMKNHHLEPLNFAVNREMKFGESQAAENLDIVFWRSSDGEDRKFVFTAAV